LQWGWNYFTYDRSARLITGLERLDGADQKAKMRASENAGS
jgi:hypothetical protein